MNWLLSLDLIGYCFSLWYMSFLWHSLLICAGILIVMYLYRRYSAGVKFMIWGLSIPVMILAPIASWYLMSTYLPVRELTVLPVHDTLKLENTSFENHGVDGNSGGKAENPFDYPYAFFIAAFSAALLCIVGIFTAGQIKIHLMACRANEIRDRKYGELLARCRRELNISRNVSLRESPDTTVPFTLGLFRPAVIIPAGLLQSIQYDEARHILLHELAHVKRFDSPLLALASLGQAFTFLNPFAWFAVSKISPFAEEACDELVVEHCGEPVCYARTLTTIAETAGNVSFGMRFATGFVFSRFVFLKRIESILSKNERGVMAMSKMSRTKLFIIFGVIITISVVFPLTLHNYNEIPYVKVKNNIKLAQTPEKKTAIKAIHMRMKAFGSHIVPAVTCADLILSADRNVKIIEAITMNYVLQSKGGTPNYVTLARLAAKAPVADDEFFQFAELIETRVWRDVLALAELAAQARTENELQEIMKKTETLKR